MCKLDIQKAYDHLNWNFLLKLMKKMGFAFRWIKWMEHCISTFKFSVLINKEPNGFFSSERGFQYADPLSPFLFIMAMEGMSNLLNKARGKWWIRGFQLSETNSFEVTHL